MIAQRFLFTLLFSAVILTSGSALLSPPAHAASVQEAARHVEQLTAKGLATLRRSDLTAGERRATLKPILREGLDIALMARAVLGEAWQDASREARTDFTLLYGDYLIGTITRKLEDYSGENIAIKETTPSGNQDFLVASTIEDSGGRITRVVWRVRDTAGAYRVIDIQVEGISLIVTTRQEFASVIKNQGLEGLLRILQGKVQTATNER